MRSFSKGLMTYELGIYHQVPRGDRIKESSEMESSKDTVLRVWGSKEMQSFASLVFKKCKVVYSLVFCIVI